MGDSLFVISQMVLTDCSSMVIMNNEGIGDVLTADIHCVQEGYKALLAS